MALRGIVFDCDGLMVDSETVDFLSWEETFASYGLTLPKSRWQEGIGSTSLTSAYDLLEQALGQTVNRDDIRAMRRPRFEQMVLARGLLPGVLATIQQAKAMGLRLAVASSSSFEWVSWCLDQFGLHHYFEHVVTADDVDITKPDPALYLEAIRRIDCPPAEAVALEDSRNGVIAARRAGIFCIAVPNPMTASLDLSQANLRLDSLEALDLRRLASRF